MRNLSQLLFFRFKCSQLTVHVKVLCVAFRGRVRRDQEEPKITNFRTHTHFRTGGSSPIHIYLNNGKVLIPHCCFTSFAKFNATTASLNKNWFVTQPTCRPASSGQSGYTMSSAKTTAFFHTLCHLLYNFCASLPRLQTQ